MPLLSILLIALGLAMDAFAVSITSGITIKNLKARHALTVGAAFGIFQAVMPLLGWLIGQWTYRFISAFDYWVAFGLLLFVGGHMILQSMQPEEEDGPKNPLHLPTLLTLAVATSIDAFAIGISLSMLRVAILTPILVIGLVTFALSFAGVYFGRFFGHFSEKKMAVAGGLVLIGLGTKMLIGHLIENHDMFESSETVWFAFGLTLAAGLATGLGSLLAFFTRQSRTRRASLLFGISTGLLLWTAFRQLIPIAETDLGSPAFSALSFFGGFILIALIDRLVPSFGNPHEPMLIEELNDDHPEFRRTDMPAVLAILAHSFPEGLAVFITALHAPAPVAVGAAIALALHNIPEGISTALPMYHATGSRAKACGFSSLTGLAEPLGALIVYSLVHRFLSGATLGILSGAGAGIMVFIALDGLLPAARVFGKYHHAVFGVLLGMLLAAALALL
ncbi:MAG: manganese efflux pump [Kiritimatiellales bacterium]